MTKKRKHPRPRQLVGLIIFAMLAAWAGSAMAAELGEIKVKSKVITNNDQIILGKIASINVKDEMLEQQLQACVIGRSPLPGKTRQIDGDYLQGKLKQAGIDLGEVALHVPDTITVTRQSTTVSAKELEAIARTFIQAHAPHDRERVNIKKIQVSQAVVLPSGNITYQVSPPQRTDYVGNIPLAITFQCNGREVKKVWVMVTLEVLCDVVVAKKPLGRYQVITAADIELKAMDMARLPNNIMILPEEVIGQRAQRTIDAQTVLSAAMIESVPLVQRGDIVAMIAESGGLKISTQGEARQKGGKGDRIKVMNLDSRKSVYARIVDRNMVQVDF